jgi:hypothetical protein
MDTSKIDGQRRLAISVRDELRRVFDTQGGYSGWENWIKTYQGSYPKAVRKFVSFIGDENKNPGHRYYSFTDKSIDDLLGVFILQELSEHSLSGR